MREHYFRPGEGFLLVYSITARETFTEIAEFHEQILRVKDKETIPGIIVANKCDLEFERQVQNSGIFSACTYTYELGLTPRHAEGRELARRLGCRFIETSAKQRLNVDEAFAELVREIRRQNRVRHLFSFGVVQ
jgi:GTPase KRas protein